MRLSEALSLFKTDYIALRGLDKSTEENYALAVVSFIKAVGDLVITDINPGHILEWRRWMESRNKPGTIRCHMSKLKNILVFTNKKNLTNFDISDIYLPKLPPPLPEYLLPEEIDRMIDTSSDLRTKAIISLLFSSGLRAGELCRLDKADIVENQAYVRQGKCNTSRMVFFDLRTQACISQYLKTRKDASPILFYSYRKRRLSTEVINRLVKGAAKAAGLDKPVHSHMMRHSFGTALVRGGVDISYVQRMMGHAFVNTTQIYVHLTNRDLAQAHKKVFLA